MKILLIGHGRMGRMIEQTALAAGDSMGGIIDIGNLSDLETIGRVADVAIDFSAPAALPALIAGRETSLGLAWKSGVAAEVLCQPKWAVGTGLQVSKAYLDAPALFAWTAAIVLLSLLTERLLRLLLRLWKGGGAA